MILLWTYQLKIEDTKKQTDQAKRMDFETLAVGANFRNKYCIASTGLSCISLHFNCVFVILLD